jgi:hypothetical protein
MEQFRDQYLVWGSYETEPSYCELSFPVIGQRCGFSPKPCLGAHIYPDSWINEWTVSENTAVHRSGVVFGSEELEIDPAVFHPATFQIETEICRRMLVELLGISALRPSTQTPPRWNSLSVQEPFVTAKESTG